MVGTSSALQAQTESNARMQESRHQIMRQVLEAVLDVPTVPSLFEHREGKRTDSRHESEVDPEVEELSQRYIDSSAERAKLDGTCLIKSQGNLFPLNALKRGALSPFFNSSLLVR